MDNGPRAVTLSLPQMLGRDTGDLARDGLVRRVVVREAGLPFSQVTLQPISATQHAAYPIYTHGEGFGLTLRLTR